MRIDNPDKFFKNRGVERNKTPLANIEIKVEIKNLNDFNNKIETEEIKEVFHPYLFKDLGYIRILKRYQRKNEIWFSNGNGFITPDDLKKLLGEKQWSKFCQGKREFIIQRRIDGKNIIKTDK